MAVKPVPEGHHTVTPYLSVQGASAAIDFYTKAFGATEVLRLAGPDGKLGHAEIQIGDSRVMLADEFPPMNFRAPRTVGGTPVHIHLYVQDVDAIYARALAAGAKTLRPIADQFYGDRSVSLEDPFGHVWHVASRKEDLTLEEIARRAPKHG